MQAQALHLPGAQWHPSDRRVPCLLPHGILWHEESRRQQQMHSWVLLSVLDTVGRFVDIHLESSRHMQTQAGQLASQHHTADVKRSVNDLFIFGIISCLCTIRGYLEEQRDILLVYFHSTTLLCKWNKNQKYENAENIDRTAVTNKSLQTGKDIN